MRTWLLALGLVAYNNLMNLWPPFHRRLYVPANLILAVTLVLIGTYVFDLDRSALGFGPNQERGLLAGGLLGLVAASPLGLALLSRKWTPILADERIRGNVAYRALLRVPVGTALPEELAFRGLLFGALLPLGVEQAVLWSSAAFGLWHIMPARNLLAENARLNGLSIGRAIVSILVIVMLAFGAGLILAGLRVGFGGLAAPFAFHAVLNSLASVAAHLANRRS